MKEKVVTKVVIKWMYNFYFFLLDVRWHNTFATLVRVREINIKIFDLLYWIWKCVKVASIQLFN